ncbi:MAG TPA: lipopolysaccharide transport periplasmic protein LptA [Xanthomonadales bacterium]|nr:lipopolysaccharide transport periplasmic protein LptA [Xanthomonadales bacterium]
MIIIILGFYAISAVALQSDRQKPLEINADTSDGTLGDGRAELRGNVEIRQGSLVIRADVAEVEKVEGRVREVILTGTPALLEQEIEQQGQVQASAERIEYKVATGLVTLTGSADVKHPQYKVSGDVLNYDLNAQHFQGSGEQENGRIRIELDPEVIEDGSQTQDPPVAEPGSDPGTDSGSESGAESENP